MEERAGLTRGERWGVKVVVAVVAFWMLTSGLWQGWLLARDTFIVQLRLEQRAIQAEQELQRLRAPAPKPGG
jgi:hypothetical protein